MLRLEARAVAQWPKLAWVARFSDGGDVVTVFHGPMVEAAKDWIVEAVWAGDFNRGDFDQTDLVVGSGIRNRQHEVVFVTSGTAVDRLWHCSHNGLLHVSNSLPALLATTGLRLREDYEGYVRDVQTIDEGGGGLSRYVGSFATDGPDLRVVYFANLVFDGRTLREIPKPDLAPRLETYRDYVAFLAATAAAIGRNASSAERRHRITPVATISSGYDSCAVAAIARNAGCDRAVTIRNSTSYWRGSDSGGEVARCLGLQCSEYKHTPRAYTLEEAVWAAIGRPRGLNYTIFDFPEPLCLFFTGNYGDKLWDLSYADVAEPTGDLSGLCLCEFRLIKGFFHCMPAWWGVRHSREIQAINRSAEMEPWRMHNKYDRPIPRRILEEAGVPRGKFAVRKKNTASEDAFWWPYDADSQASFRSYLEARGLPAVPPALVPAIRKAAHWETLVHSNFSKIIGIDKRFRPWNSMASRHSLFQWANHELKKRYLENLGGMKEPAIASATDGAAGR